MGKQEMKSSMIVVNYAPEHIVCANDECDSGDILVEAYHNQLHAISSGWSRIRNEGHTLFICPGCSQEIK